MDRMIKAAIDLQRQEEATSFGMCREAAQQCGRLAIADECDDGHVACPKCPWASPTSQMAGALGNG